MNIEDVKVGMKVKLISTANTEEHLGYDEEYMLSVGETGVVDDIITDIFTPDHVLLEGGDYYDIRDLEAVEEVKEKSICNLTVSISTEVKQEIAKDILKIILEDLNLVITNAIQSLSEVSCGEVGKGVIGESVLTVGKLDEDVLSNLLLLIDDAAENRNYQTLDVLTKAYQRIKSVQTI